MKQIKKSFLQKLFTGAILFLLSFYCVVADNNHSSVAGSTTLSCTTTISTFPYTESFENSSNGWNAAVSVDDFDWTWHTGSTTSGSTGPTAAYDGSYYYYTESSYPNYPDKRAILESPCFDLSAKSSADFTFYYHMYGDNIGTLDIEISTDGASWTSLWSLTGDQGNQWSQASIDLSSYVNSTVKLRFNALVGANTSNGYHSDFAVDYVTVTASSSGGGGLSCTQTITSFPYSESFESSSNTWENETGNDDIDWKWQANYTSSSNTGPSSAQDGSYYYYTEASGYSNKTALLNGPCLDLSGESSGQATFYYHMYGATMGTLELQATTDGSTWTSLWSLSGNQGNQWSQATVDLSSYAGNTVQLRFSGLTGSSYTSDISIDNFNVTTAAPAQLSGGTISPSSLSINSGQSPGTISNVTAASGGSGSYSYQWQKTTNSGSLWSNITGATSTSYSPGTLTLTTWYRRKVTSGTETTYSNTSEITVTTSGGGDVTSVNGNTGDVLLNLSNSVSGTNRTIKISGGASTTFSVADNDNNSSNEFQTLSLSGEQLSLSDGGGTVTLPSSSGGDADNLGNHTATQNLKLNNYWLSGDGGNEGLYVNSTGYVGIGTNSPGSYKLAVKGKIRAEEVIVETGWADYVFESNYKLKTLAEIEQFIKINGHLPGIPSKTRVKKDGVSIGEINAKLLEKIEELTLYIIEQEKRIIELENKE